MESNFFEPILEFLPQNYSKLFVDKIIVSPRIRKKANDYYNSRSFRLSESPFPISKMSIEIPDDK